MQSTKFSPLDPLRVQLINVPSLSESMASSSDCQGEASSGEATCESPEMEVSVVLTDLFSGLFYTHWVLYPGADWDWDCTKKWMFHPFAKLLDTMEDMMNVTCQSQPALTNTYLTILKSLSSARFQPWTQRYQPGDTQLDQARINCISAYYKWHKFTSKSDFVTLDILEPM